MAQYTYQRSRTSQRKHQTRTSHPDWKSLLLFYVLPFAAVNGCIFYLATAKPKYEVSISETHDYMSTSITFTIKSLLPTKNLSVSINAAPVELEKTGQKTYTAVITQNGVLEISLDNFNGMNRTHYENIDILDDGLPTLTAYSIEDGILTLSLADSQSGIDYSSIHAINAVGTRIAPVSIDKTTGRISLEMDEGGLTLFVSDMSGNLLEQPFSVSGGGQVELDTQASTE